MRVMIFAKSSPEGEGQPIGSEGMELEIRPVFEMPDDMPGPADA